MKVDQVLACFDYDDYEKVIMVTYEFTKYALEIREGRRRHSDTWTNLRHELRLRFIPASYVRDLYNKLMHYHRDIKVALMRANVLESNEATMTCFLHGLNKDIQDIMELYHHASMNNLRCLTLKRTYPNGPSIAWVKRRRNIGKERTRVQRRGVPYPNDEKKKEHYKSSSSDQK
ncbi:hypothetical protein CR513_12835, partial [Mucuna pruriens]